MTASFRQPPQAPADGRRSRDPCARIEILRDECDAIAKVAQPGDSLQDICTKLEAEGRPIIRQRVWRRITLMRHDLAEAGDIVLSKPDTHGNPAWAGRVAKVWAKHRL